MIPLTVCNADQPLWYGIALLVLLIPAGVGGLIGRWSRGRHWQASLLPILIACILPIIAASSGVWPFDPAWADCSITPDPNIWVFYALLASPFTTLAVFTATRLQTR
jgi:hypothetical protein